MPKAKKLPWVPAWLRNNQWARVGLSVLGEPGKGAGDLDWEEMWVQRVLDLASQEPNLEDLELVQMWEKLQGGQPLVRKPEHILRLVRLAAPGLWVELNKAQDGDQKACNRPYPLSA